MGSPPMDQPDAIERKTKSRGPIPAQCDGIGYACRGTRRNGEALPAWAEWQIRSDEMTRFIYALKEIRACLEAEMLTDIQQRLALLTRDMENHNGYLVHH